MAIFDFASRSIVLKVVYYGCAMGGKTTNLITLHRLTDPDNKQGMVSIATKNDRTLFFDLVPMDLGRIGGLTVSVKVYTVPGQVHYETTRRQVLSGSDGVVAVIDSAPDMSKANGWSLENLAHNMKLNSLSPETTPIVLQWNKRDLPNAVPVERLEADFNKKQLPSHASVATSGEGVVETFAAVVKAAIQAAYSKAGRGAVATEELDRMVDAALGATQAKALPSEPKTPDFDHRFDSDQYHEDWAEKGRDRKIVDQETLLSEAVQTSMELAERLEDSRSIEGVSQRRGAMLELLEQLASELSDPDKPALPGSLMARLLEASRRTRGSLLLFKPNDKVMNEREIVPAGADPLNEGVSSLGSAAYRLSQGDQPRVVEDLVSEAFFERVPPGASDLVGCYLAPVFCDGMRFGSLVAYATLDERSFGPAERAFWAATGRLVGLALHWRGLRRKLTQSQPC